MAITYGDRFGLPNWGDGAVDGPTRAQFNTANASVEDLAAIDVQDTLANKILEPAGTRGRYWFTEDTDEFFRDKGDEWIQLPTFTTAGTWTEKQSISSNTQPQFYIETETATGAAQVLQRRRTVTDGSTYTEILSEATANVFRLVARKNSTSGIGNDFSGMEGRWAINHNSDTAPADTLVIKAKAGAEIARFTEGGYLGIGVVPTRALDVRSAADRTPVARFGGPAGNDQENALTMTPMGIGRMLFAFGADVVGSTHTLRETTAGELDIAGNVFTWYTGAGTAGNTFTPSKKFQIDANGTGYIGEFQVGAGALSGSGLRMRSFNADGTEAVLSSQNGSTTTRLVLEAQGSDARVDIKPETQRTASFFRQSNGSLISANLGWTVLGSATPVGDNVDGVNFPGCRLVRATDIIGGDGTIHTVHGLGSNLPRQILHVDAWARRSDGSAQALIVDIVDGTSVHAHTNDLSFVGHRASVAIQYAQTTVIWT